MQPRLTRAVLALFFASIIGSAAWASDASEIPFAQTPPTYATATHSRAVHTVRWAAKRSAPQEHSALSALASAGSSLVAEAKRYLGTNPTGRRSLWCGAFMDKVLRETGHKGGGNLALGYLHYGKRVSGPRVGAIAVMGRKGGGHVGVVSGVDANGNPIIVSGNTWGKGSSRPRVLEQAYPKGRIIAYIEPTR